MSGLFRASSLMCAMFASLVSGRVVAAEERGGETVEIGVAVRFMPVGWFDVKDAEVAAIPALGAAAFVDCRVSNYFSLGLSPELTLNVIPDTVHYTVGKMYGVKVRMGARYPTGRRVEPYAILAAGYSSIDLTDGPAATGPTISAAGGARLRASERHFIFAEASLEKGFQRVDGGRYAPSYVVTSIGWVTSL